MVEPISTRDKNEAFKQARMDQEKEAARIEQEAKDKKIAEDNKKKANAANSKEKDNRKKLGRDDLKTIDVGALIAQKPAQIFDMMGFLRANLDEMENDASADSDFVADLQSKIAEIQKEVIDKGIKYDPNEKKDDDILPENGQQNATKDLDDNELVGHADKKRRLDPNLLDQSKFAAAKAPGDNDVISSTAFHSPSAVNQGGGVVQQQRPGTSVSDFSSFNLWASERAKRHAAVAAANPGASDSEIKDMMR